MIPLALLNVFFLASKMTFPVPPGATVVDGWGVPVEVKVEDAKADVVTLAPGHYTVVPEGEGTRPMFAVVQQPDMAAESPFGVMTHYAQTWGPDSIPVFAAAGIKYVRDEIFWDSVEAERGQYGMPEKFTRYMNDLVANDMEPLIVLSFGNKHYDVTPGIPVWAAAPYTQEGFEGYANYAKYILTHWGDRIKHVEVWNEYNGNFARGPANGNPLVYREMLKHAYRAVKSVRPDVKVYSCSTIGIPLDWIETVFQDGGIDHCDGVSVHPYGYTTPPEMLIGNLEKLRELIRRYNNNTDKPIWVTEQGWYLTTDAKARKGNREAITEATQARYLARAWTIFLANGVERIFWYVGRNDNIFPNMGLMTSDKDARGKYAPKPAYVAYAALIAQLREHSFVEKEKSDVNVYKFARGDEELRVIWDEHRGNKTISFAAKSAVEVTDLYGRTRVLHPFNGRVHLFVSDSPLYFRGKVEGLPRTEEKWMKVEVANKVARGSIMPLQIALREGCTLEATEPFLDPDGFEQVRPFAVTNAQGETIFVGVPRAEIVEPVVVSRYPLAVDATRVDVVVENNTTEAVTVSEVTYGDGVNAVTVTPGVAVKPGETTRVAIRVEPLTPYEIRTAQMVVKLDGGNEILTQGKVAWCPVLPRTPDLKRGISAFEGLPKMNVDTWEYQRLEADCDGPEDLGGYFQFCQDADNFYFCASISDNVHHQRDSGNNTWRGDNLQLGIATSMPWLGGEWFGMSRKEFGVSLTPDGPEVYEGGRKVPGAVVYIVRDEESKHTDYVFSLPWPAMGLSGAEDFSMGLYVNDNDGKGRKGFKHWASMKEISEFQPFRLQE